MGQNGAKIGNTIFSTLSTKDADRHWNKPPLSGYHVCRVRCWCWAPRCRINLRDCSAGGWPGQLYSQYHLAESVPVPGGTGNKNLNESPASPVPWTSLITTPHCYWRMWGSQLTVPEMMSWLLVTALTLLFPLSEARPGKHFIIETEDAGDGNYSCLFSLQTSR